MDELKEKIQELNIEIKNYKEQFTDFVEAASHDLNAPLRKLSVLIERLFSKYELQLDEEAKQYINRIQTCIREMKSLIDGMTELARTDGEEAELELCDLTVIVKQELENMKEEIAEKNLRIQVGNLPAIMGIAFQYKQLFKNLLENAIKFSQKNNPVKIDVRAELLKDKETKDFDLDTGKKYYRIDIIDNGVGFKQDYAEKIFEPFVRLHPRSEYEGNGIGLSICKRIVMNHKGKIFAEGNENRGSRFVIILPETP